MMFDIRKLILERAVKEIQDGMCVNLGIGMPTLIADMIPSDFNVMLQLQDGVTLDEVKEKTEANFSIAQTLKINR